MPINKETIISVFDKKLTLMQWLKTINKALEDAVLTGVEITKKGNATLSFKFTFEDGTFLETNDIVLQQGESVNGAYIQNGHLYLTLTNGQTLDTGNVKPVSSFSIDASQHLIVNYGDGTSQDLGAIFNGNVNIDGNFTANSIIENMSGYSFNENSKDSRVTNTYVSAVKNGNKVTFVVCGTLTLPNDIGVGGYIDLGGFNMPSSVGTNIVPNFDGTRVGPSPCMIAKDVQHVASHSCFLAKYRDAYSEVYFNPVANIEAGTYYFRFEVTFLLSANMVG